MSYHTFLNPQLLLKHALKNNKTYTFHSTWHQVVYLWFISFKVVGLGYGRYLYFQCLLKYMIICAFENSPSIPSFLVTKIVYIGYGQLTKWLLFLLPFHSCAPCRAHRTRRSSCPISTEVALPRLQSEIKVVLLFLFASHSFVLNGGRTIGLMWALIFITVAVRFSPKRLEIYL
jgi:hypothetical protein